MRVPLPAARMTAASLSCFISTSHKKIGAIIRQRHTGVKNSTLPNKRKIFALEEVYK
jgi:hypothetical protein